MNSTIKKNVQRHVTKLIPRVVLDAYDVTVRYYAIPTHSWVKNRVVVEA